MAQKESVHRYVLKVYGSSVGLKPYPKTTGTYFEVYKDSDDGQWYWKLHSAGSRHGAAARSGTGYTSRQSAEGTIKTAVMAMRILRRG